MLIFHQFIPEVLLRQPGFLCGPCGPSKKGKEIFKTIKETDDPKPALQKVCFQNFFAYSNKHLEKKDTRMGENKFNIEIREDQHHLFKCFF